MTPTPFTSIRTAHPTRTRLAAVTAALAGATLLLAGCGDKSNDDAAPAAKQDAPAAEQTAPPTNSAWQSESMEFLIIDGSDVTFIDTDDESYDAAIRDIKSDQIEEAPDPSSAKTKAGYSVTHGTLNDEMDTVVWDEDSYLPMDTSDIAITSDTVDLDDDLPYVPLDSDQAKAERESWNPVA